MRSSLRKKSVCFSFVVLIIVALVVLWLAEAKKSQNFSLPRVNPRYESSSHSTAGGLRSY